MRKAKTGPRVLLVCPVGDELGGAEQVMLAIGRELPRHGFSPVVVSMRPGKLADVARSQGMEAYAFERQHQYRDVGAVVQASQWLGDVIRETRAQLLHATHTAHLYAWMAGRRARTPEIWHIHDLPSRRDPVGLLTGKMTPAFTIFTTAAVAAAYPRLRRFPNAIIPPSCVEPEELRSRARRSDLRERLQLPSGRMLLTVTRLQQHKGHETLLKAAAEVLKVQRDAVFVIVGAAKTTEQESYRKELRSQIQQLGISESVFLLGFVDDADLAELYREATALVHPAWSEGYGLVLLEAMSMELAVVAADATGPAEIIRDGENGLLVPVQDASALATGVLRVLNDGELRQRLKIAGAATAQQLTLGDMVSRVAGVYRDVLSRAK